MVIKDKAFKYLDLTEYLVVAYKAGGPTEDRRGRTVNICSR